MASADFFNATISALLRKLRYSIIGFQFTSSLNFVNYNIFCVETMGANNFTKNRTNNSHCLGMLVFLLALLA